MLGINKTLLESSTIVDNKVVFTTTREFDKEKMLEVKALLTKQKKDIEEELALVDAKLLLLEDK